MPLRSGMVQWLVSKRGCRCSEITPRLTESRGLPPSPLHRLIQRPSLFLSFSPSLSPVTLFISRCTFRLPRFLPFHRRFPSSSLLSRIRSFFFFFPPRPYRGEESPIFSPFLFLHTSFRSYYRSRTFSRRCPPSREHKIQPGILISPPLCRATVPVPTDYFDPAQDHSRFRV